jgi:hypothetical protein
MDSKVVPRGERRKSVDTYMNSMSSTSNTNKIENGLQRQPQPRYRIFAAFSPNFLLNSTALK